MDLLPARGVVPFLFPGDDGSHLHGASAERGSPRSETSPKEGASFGAREHASSPLPWRGVERCAPASSSRVTTCAPARVPVIGPKRLPDIRLLHETARVQLGTRMVAGVIRGSCAVDRDNPVFEFAPELPEAGRRYDGFLQVFDDLFRFVRIKRPPAPTGAAEDAVAFGVRGESENCSHGDSGLLP